MNRIPWLLAGLLLPAGPLSASAQVSKQVELYHWVDFQMEAPGAADGIDKWDVEGSCVWTHESGADRRTSLLWYSGGKDTYVYRFGGSLPGRWTGTTRSPVAALDGLELTVDVGPSSNPNRIGWSGQRSDESTAWAHQKGPAGQLVKRTPILIMMPDVGRWHDNLAGMRTYIAEFHENHGFNGGHISTIGRSWFEIGSTDNLRAAPAAPDVRTFAALEAAASEWSERGGWLHLWMWGKGGSGDFSNLPGGYSGEHSERINRYLAARLGPVPGWSMGIGWDVEFWADEAKIKWWLNDLAPQLGGWHHWIGARYSDSDIGQGHDPEPANKGEYLARGITWNTLRPGSEQYAGWEHWATMTSDSEIDAGLAALADRPMMSEDRFRRRDGAWPQKDLHSDDDILKEIPRWAGRGVGAIYGRLLDPHVEGSETWPNKAAIKAMATAWHHGAAYADNADRIQPWSQNPTYWQYKGRPVMLLGGSKTDHIFLLDDLKEHLDEIHAVKANYVRNTMSQREGIELKPHKLLPDGKFDMDQWNDDYWQRFQNMLKWTHERDIIVQIEVWDRFDYAEGNWEISPWNPKNNVNYDYEESGFGTEYRNNHLYRDEHPFFHTIEGTRQYTSRYDLIRKHQESFVDKMLSYSLPYGHVLYCMNNETSSEVGWGQYWIRYIQARAAEKGVTVWATDMFDDAHLGPQAKNAPIVFDDPALYMFADISQVNSRNFDQMHWDRLQWLLQQINKHPRPGNHTKIYGSGYHSFGTGGPEDGIERFWRNILGGSAAARFHRPDAGNGLNDLAMGSIMAARILEDQIKFWDLTPHLELLSDREPNEAYLAAKPGEYYALYFTNGGSVGLDLSDAPGSFSVTWISVAMGIPVQTSQTGAYRLMDKSIEGGRVVTLAAPYKGGWVAALVKQ